MAYLCSLIFTAWKNNKRIDKQKWLEYTIYIFACIGLLCLH